MKTTEEVAAAYETLDDQGKERVSEVLDRVSERSASRAARAERDAEPPTE